MTGVAAASALPDFLRVTCCGCCTCDRVSAGNLAPAAASLLIKSRLKRSATGPPRLSKMSLASTRSTACGGASRPGSTRNCTVVSTALAEPDSVAAAGLEMERILVMVTLLGPANGSSAWMASLNAARTDGATTARASKPGSVTAQEMWSSAARLAKSRAAEWAGQRTCLSSAAPGRRSHGSSRSSGREAFNLLSLPSELTECSFCSRATPDLSLSTFVSSGTSSAAPATTSAALSVSAKWIEAGAKPGDGGMESSKSTTSTKTPWGSSLAPYAGTTSRPRPCGAVASSWNSAVAPVCRRSKLQPLAVMLSSLSQSMDRGPAGMSSFCGTSGWPEICCEPMVRVS
mmetsp:Transcript_25031/g.71800  ORF Transcript_25031/g.71800 Transcript_25031/m.71800 type:complete len:345 (-) Transcript_25031:993-2027(-)